MLYLKPFSNIVRKVTALALCNFCLCLVLNDIWAKNNMELQIKIKDVFEPHVMHKEFYTGGLLEVTNDGKTLFCQCRNHVTIVDVNSAQIIQTIPDGLEEYNLHTDENTIEDPILTFSVSSDDNLVATGHKSGLIKLWQWKEKELLKSWKSTHRGPILKLAFNRDSSYLSSGGTDSAIRVWDIENRTCLFKLGGLQGVTSILQYNMIQNEEVLLAVGDEVLIHGWKLSDDGAKKLVYKLKSQFSRITKLLVSQDGQYLISCSLDKTIVLWNLETKEKVGTMLQFASVETATLLPECVHLPGYEKPVNGVHVATGTQDGSVRVWNVVTGKELYARKRKGVETPIVHLHYNEAEKCLIEVNANQSIYIINLDCTFSSRKQLVGCHDEILDLTFFGEEEEYLAVATNSSNIYLYDKNMNCRFVSGHSDFVICFSTTNLHSNLLVSGSKDNDIRVWMMKDDEMNCVAVGERHTASVGSIAISNNPHHPYVVSVSEDNTMALWHLPTLKFKECCNLEARRTVVAHEQAINSVAISPNDKCIATASQDKTAKLWSSASLSFVGVLRGHRRGVWSVKFSPVDQVILTSSGDTTLRLWSVADLSCLKTFEGQDSAIMNCSFLNKGIQIVGCGNDGVIKIWLIKSGECIATLDKHAAKIWAIVVNKSESKFVTGGSDSRIITWIDKTEETRLQTIKANQEKVEQEQQLMNLVQANELLPALKLSISLDRPHQTLKIIEKISDLKLNRLKEVLDDLEVEHKGRLLKYASEWNTNSKHSYEAQVIMSLLIGDVVSNKIKIEDKTLEGSLAYTERHYNRLAGLLEDLQIITYTVKQMEG